MAWFFKSENITTEYVTLSGETAAHIARSLRMKKGERITLCTPDGKRHDGKIIELSRTEVTVKVIESTVCEQEPTVKISVFSALMKGDGMDEVIQKSVELGAFDFYPFLSARCVSRPDEKSLRKKRERWQKIAESAASQSRRGIVPKVHAATQLSSLEKTLKGFDKAVVFYECGGEPIKKLIDPEDKKIALITGAEGGFEEKEIERLREAGVKVATLGKRILRARTAPVAATAAVMLLTGNLE